MAFQIRKDINEFYKGKSQHWMETENDDNVLDSSKIQNGNYILKFKKDDDLNDYNDVKNT